MRIIQISDSHIANDIPQRLTDLDNCIAAINKLPTTPDLVVHTGDITHNGLAQEFATARQSLDKLKAPYTVLAGNKDNRDELKLAFKDHRYLKQQGKFVQYSLEQFPVRVIVLDTVRENDSKGELCNQRLYHLKQMLAKDTAKPAVVFMHHSPFEVKEIPDPRQFSTWTQIQALDTLLASSSNIEGVYCGHVHRNVEGSIGDLPVNVLSCIATDLRKGQLDQQEKTRPMFTEIDFSKITEAEV